MNSKLKHLGTYSIYILDQRHGWMFRVRLRYITHIIQCIRKFAVNLGYGT
jgi:hypothetical protein